MDKLTERKAHLDAARRERARKIVAYLKKAYPKPKSELKYKTQFQSSVTFFKNKAKAVIAAAKIVCDDFGGCVPQSADDLQKLPGVGYKTAHVIMGELFDEWPGIPTDTHVRRFALRFDLVNSKDLNKISKDLEALIPKKDWKYVNNGLVLYGRYICKAKNHDCSHHALTAIWPASRMIWPKAK